MEIQNCQITHLEKFRNYVVEEIDTKYVSI